MNFSMAFFHWSWRRLSSPIIFNWFISLSTYSIKMSSPVIKTFSYCPLSLFSCAAWLLRLGYFADCDEFVLPVIGLLCEWCSACLLTYWGVCFTSLWLLWKPCDFSLSLFDADWICLCPPRELFCVELTALSWFCFLYCSYVVGGSLIS